MNDPASLQNLNEIVLPAPAPWWPPAPGWYVLLALLLAAFTVWALRRYRHWRSQRYRREALALLQSYRKGGQAEKLPGLIKRAAMAAWPREQVAAMSGTRWHDFLDQVAGMDRFSGPAGESLDSLAYGGATASLQHDQVAELFDAAEFWLKHHRVSLASAAAQAEA